MEKLIALVAFSWSHRGVEVEHFAAGQEIETDDEDLIRVARAEGWVEGAEPDPEAEPATKPSRKK